VLGSVVALGALGSGLAFVLSLRNVRLIGASMSSMVTYLMPIFAIIVGVLVLHEHLTWYQPVGALIVLTGVAVSQGAARAVLIARWGSKPKTPAEVSPAPVR
jgi:drug/metabolite transporter (DMT)-like permease